MHHSFIDTYADLDTPLHRIDARKKIIILIAFLLVIILTPARYTAAFLLYGIVIVGLIYTSRAPLKFIFKRVIEIMPFIIVISISTLFGKQGYALFFSCVIKATMAMLLVLIVSSTTKFTQLLEALRRLRMPKLFVDLLSFMYRYSFLLEDQFLRTKCAYMSRNVNNKNDFRKVRVLSNILGGIFIHTYERAERVYLAMCARGYDEK